VCLFVPEVFLNVYVFFSSFSAIWVFQHFCCHTSLVLNGDFSEDEECICGSANYPITFLSPSLTSFPKAECDKRAN